MLVARKRLPPEKSTHSADKSTVVRFLGVKGNIRVFAPIWSSIDEMIWSSGIMECTKSLAGSVNCDKGCLTSIFSDMCTNAPVDWRLGYQKAFNLSRSAFAISILLSAIFRLWFPWFNRCSDSSKLNGICASIWPMEKYKVNSIKSRLFFFILVRLYLNLRYSNRWKERFVHQKEYSNTTKEGFNAFL